MNLEHDIFRISPIAILCEDWSRIHRMVKQKVSEGVSDFYAYLQANPEFIFEARRRHTVLDANPAALALLDVPDMASLAARVSELLPADPSSNGQVMCAIAEGRNFCNGERRLRRRDGSVVHLLWRTTFPIGEDRFDRVYFFGVDITEEKKAEEALHLAQSNLSHAARLSLVGELTASVAHELSQPLGAIASYAGAALRWLSADPPNIAEAASGVTRIGSSSRHAGQILTRIKDFSRRGQPLRQRLSPFDIVHKAITLVEHEVHRHGAVLSVEVPEGLPEVEGDPTQVQQVIINIVMNAVQAMAPANCRERRASVSVRHGEPGELAFVIDDTGPGLNADIRNQVFEPFFSTKNDGVGLGLSICRRIAEEHGGRLWMNTTGSGASFGLSLPVADERGPAWPISKYTASLGISSR